MVMHSRRGASVAVCFAVGLVAFGGVDSVLAERVTYARNLALSPDGSTLAFSWAGDIWIVSSDGGQARRLTVHPKHDADPVWSHDGLLIAFSSTRHGAADVFVMNADGGDVRRLTFADATEIPTDFSPDGATVYFHARKQGELPWEPRMYTVPTAGGQSWLVSEAMGHEVRISPDGSQMLLGRGVSRWWRTGYRGSANWDVWLRDMNDGAFSRQTEFDGTDMRPQWDADGKGFYFLSDRKDVHNVWFKTIGGVATQVTNQRDERVRDYSVSRNGKRLAYTVWDKQFVMDMPRGAAREITITAASDRTTNPYDLETLRGDASETEVSPDEKEMALVVRGEIYVISTEEGKPTRRVTDSPARDQHVVWSPDGKALFFVSDRDGQEDIYRARSAEEPAKALSESLRFVVERVTDDPLYEAYPALSPDGKKLAFTRQRGDVIIRDLKSGDEHVLLESANQATYRWSPDSEWIAYEVEDNEYNPDVWITRADGEGEPVNISQHPDGDGNPQFSADGKILAFASARQGFDSDLYLVFLDPTIDEKSSAELDAYFEEAGKEAGKRKPLKKAVASGKIKLAGQPAPSDDDEEADDAAEDDDSADDADDDEGEEPADDDADEDEGDEATKAEEEKVDVVDQLRAALKAFLADEDKKKEKKKPEQEEKVELNWDLDTAYRRVRRVTSLPGDQGSFALAPAGDALLFTSSHTGDGKLYRIDWDGDDLKEVLGSSVGALHIGLTGKKAYYLRGGTPGSIGVGGGKADRHAFRAKMTIDFAAAARQKYADGARMLGRMFYHPSLKGLNWDALTEKHRELAATVHTWPEFNEIFDLQQGMLNGSHLGIYGPNRGGGESIGYLGVDFDKSFAGPGLKVTRVLADSPADRKESRLYVGDVLIKVNGQPVGPGAAIEAALIDTIGDEIIVAYAPSPEREVKKEATEEDEATDQDEASNEDADQSDDEGGESTATGSEESEAADDAEAAEVENEPTELVIRPISYNSFRNLKYEEWVRDNRKYVEENSNGRLGYAHIRGMGEPQFYTFERDLYAAAHGKDGLIIDVRNNGGGWTADWVMATLSVRRHAFTVGRGGEPGYPQGRLIFYAWTKPATMMCNQYSYSNAEIVSHAFKNLKRGPLVGMTTYGAVISTGGYNLLDGTLVRMPFRGWWTLPEKQDMDVHGAEPTNKVPVTPADEEAGRRPQLDEAIRVTLKEIERKGSSDGIPEDSPLEQD